MRDSYIVNVKVLISAGIALGVLALGTNANADVYTVKSGDTLSEIAQVHGTTIADIVSINQIQNENLIFVGDKIEIGNIVENETVSAQATEVAPVAVIAEQEDVSTPVVQQVQQEPQEVVVPQATQPVSVPETTPVVNSSAKEIIAQRESSGNYDAQNGRYQGRYQLDASYLNGDYSPANQERVADEYVAGRYGSWDNALAFWNNNGWY